MQCGVHVYQGVPISCVRIFPQAVPDYLKVQHLAADAGTPAEAKATIQSHLESRRKRQRAWLGKSSEVGWRPRKRHRTGAYKWMLTLENHLRAAGMDMSRFVVDDSMLVSGLPLEWPRLSLAIDLGTDGYCAVGFMQRKLAMNVDMCPDPSHGVDNNISLAIKRAGLQEHMHMALISRNVQHGPYKEGRRYQEVLTALSEVFEAEGPSTCPLFQQMLPFMLQDRGWSHRMGEDRIAETMWKPMRDESPFRIKGTSVNPSRFLGPLRQARHEDEAADWHFKRFGYTYTCLEMDFLRGKELKKLVLKTGPPAGARMRQPAIEEKAIRAAMCNAMVLCTLFLSDLDHQVYSRIIIVGCQFWDAWHSEQNSFLRSAQGSEIWMGEQIKGKYMDTINSTLALLGDAAALKRIGFRTKFSDHEAAELVEGHPAVVRDDEFADHFGMLILELTSLRLQWACMMLRGWPSRSVAMVPGPHYCESHLPALLLDYDNFKQMEAKAGELGGVVQSIVARSCFNLPIVKQLVQVASQAEDGVLGAAAADWVSKGHCRIIATQLIEDGNKRQRRREEQLIGKRSRESMEYIMLIRKKVLSQVHKFDEVRPHPHKLGRSLTLPKGAYNPFGHECSVNIKPVMSLKPSPDWYSPKPENHCVAYCDLAFSNIVVARGLFDKADNVFLGCLLRDGHLLIRPSTGEQREPYEGWYFSLRDVPGSASFILPARHVEVGVPGQPRAFVPDSNAAGLHFAAVLDENDWEAMAFEWRSPAWLFAKSRSRNPSLLAAAVAPDPPAPLIIVAARNAFWQLGSVQMRAIAVYKGIEIPVPADDFTACFTLVQGILQLTDSETLLIVKQRAFKCKRRSSSAMDALMEFQDAGEMLSPQDEQRFRKDQQDWQSKAQSASDFLQLAQQKGEDIQAAQFARCRAKAKAKALAARQRPWGDRQYCPVPDGAVTQPEAAKLCPPGGRIWRNNYSGGWECHLAPFKRLARLDRLVSHKGGLLICLRYMWKLYLQDLHSLPLSACPIEGLLGPEAEAPELGGGS